MKGLKLAATVTASLALITVTAAAANARQLCESDTPGWTACIETQPDGL
jgi:hypothetical protein